MGIEPWKTQTATEVGAHCPRKPLETRSPSWVPILKENLHSVLTEDRLRRKDMKVGPTVHPSSCLANLRSSTIVPPTQTLGHLTSPTPLNLVITPSVLDS